ncbi:MAG: XRE family transcriptional regulator [Candidatus Thermoplasmatota archaeon]|nr:ImmA/IrrE family metallo-endopeptidase [Euryarchaeota archaeon]MBU4032434.1 XRE family transcriptional regulator [Candidatus Thermoplasmatota archaeon]MBU4072364.1 XRE family transcriptional regulator [Candidatus Thermoplasmatota archaeon]MBU4144068.1 XRE family transcriptional regulator [Candidatus Thermoplasmatota archaeon]MBU4591544.1 XRE family transcriptional regulator [Candidatus Thermoplasmatota archaeon]
MSRTLKVEVDPKVFKWLRESAGWTKEEVAKRLGTSIEVVEAIEARERQPTLRQLKELSNAYKRPLAAFLLSKPLEEPPLPKDYRMLPGKQDVFDKKTIYAIRKARNLQDVGAELLINFNDSAKPKVKRLKVADNPELVAIKCRETFNLSVEAQRKFRNSYELFNYLRDKIEEMNILVFQFSMPVEDARGFALTDENPNVIIINSADSIEARVFSVLHELGHVLLGETAIDLPDISVATSHKVENWCNSFASEFLLPKEIAKAVFKFEGGNLTEPKTLGKLSRRFKVSKGMLSYKMLKLNFITKLVYEKILNRYKPGESVPKPDEEKKKGGGIPAEVRCLSEVGNKFVSMVANNYDRNFITYTDALNYLSIRSKNFNSVLARAKQ